ncbi:hypothetical protein HDE_05520 [Halotydeus destructor]|nr:hypothetical protein HDE_05520 [Halotydeus destructor]
MEKLSIGKILLLVAILSAGPIRVIKAYEMMQLVGHVFDLIGSLVQLLSGSAEAGTGGTSSGRRAAKCIGERSLDLGDTCDRLVACKSVNCYHSRCSNLLDMCQEPDSFPTQCMSGRVRSSDGLCAATAEQTAADCFCTDTTRGVEKYCRPPADNATSTQGSV